MINGKTGIVTVRSAWKSAREAGETSDSLKAYARKRARTLDAVGLDAARWFEAKQPGGTDAQRIERTAHRKEQHARNAASGKKGKGSVVIKAGPDSSRKKGR